MDRSPGSGPGSPSPNHQNLINFSIFPKIAGKKVITTQWTKKEIRRPMHHQGARASRGPTRDSDAGIVLAGDTSQDPERNARTNLALAPSLAS